MTQAYPIREFEGNGWILISNLEIESCIGIYPNERVKEQTLFLHLALLSPMNATDSIKETIDYDEVINLCKQIGKEHSFFLVETFGITLLGALFTKFKKLLRARVRVEKKIGEKSLLCGMEIEKGREELCPYS